ncbi:BatD family protein [Chryseobacterium foetidum]|uniref:BatD family protein n=1 Tax=Chryseobacterium foetidum TaxID=2951057 RepID=UPI0021CA574B|nr:BatD family protein [Chryseobacterium foetidum]
MTEKFIYILILLTSIATYGQVNLTMKSDKSDYEGRDIINLTIVLELNGDDLVQQSRLQLPDLSKFNMVGSASYRDGLLDPETNTNSTKSITRIALEPKQKGKIRIGSVLVNINNKIYKTEPFDIFIKDIEKKVPAKTVASSDVYLNMEIDDREVYQDQPTVAILRGYSRNIDNLRKVKNIKLPKEENLDVHPINFNKSEIDPSGISNMPTQILAVFMVFPNEAGYVEVPAVSASVSSYSGSNKIASNKVKLNVKKLPADAPEGFNNAVGKFKVDVYKSTDEKVEAKKPINVTVKVSGEGNLANMHLPEIEKSDDYEIFAPKIVNNFVAGQGGFTGNISANYIIIPHKAGILNIKTEEFSFFNPDNEEYINIGSKSLVLNALTAEQLADSKTTVEKMNDYTNDFLETVDSPVLQTTAFKVKEKRKFNWNILLINTSILLGLLMIYFAFRKWQKKQRLVAESISTKPLGSVAETEAEIRERLKTDVSDYFSYLNNLKSEQNFEAFFSTVSELDAEVRNEYFQSQGGSFVSFLENFKGRSVAEEYQNLEQRIQMEKYSPVRSEHSLDDLYKDIINIYSKISK